MAADSPAFRQAFESNSIDWEEAFPGHCFICHIATADDDDDTIWCGPHCEGYTAGAE